MFWGTFFVLLGGLLLLDYGDVYHGGFLSKLLISGLISWGVAMLFDRTRWCLCMQARRTNGPIAPATIAGSTSADDTTR